MRLVLLVVLLLAAACTPAPSPANPAQSVTADSAVGQPTATPIPPTPTPEPPRVLTVCMGSEPTSLFVYADTSAAARSVRQALYDGPVDVQDYAYSPVILAEIPGLGNGGVRIETVSVSSGTPIQDVEGDTVALQTGVSYLPSGCGDSTCALTYDGSTPAQVDQQVVTMHLKPGLTWSDGAALTADDSLFSYEVARSLYPRVRSDLLARTSSYQVIDETTIEWRGVPGHRDAYASQYFFFPLPRHAWGAMSVEELLTLDLVNRQPLGWGPYQVEEWTTGDHITLVANPNYFRAGEELPRFDRLVFRFVPDPKAALAALQAGECDYVDESAGLARLLPQVSELEAAKTIKTAVAVGTAWESLTLNVQPKSTDPYIPPVSIFGEKTTRQAIAACIDRQAIAEAVWNGKAQVAGSYVAVANPLFNAEARKISYDPTAAAEQLQAAGWVDADGDPNTPRIAAGMTGVPAGTPLSFTLLTGQDSEKTTVAEMLRQDLSECGVGVQVQALPWNELMAAGPGGPIFGRSFQAAQFGWTSGLEPACALYTTDQIPGPYPESTVGWGGANAGGWSNAEFDQACRRAQFSLAEEQAFGEAHKQAQAIFAEELPVIPLYERISLIAMRPDMCGVNFDASADGSLVSLESLDYGEGCQP